jgi:hypothetical protein
MSRKRHFTHGVKLNCSIHQFYAAMEFLESDMKLEGERDWTPDMRLHGEDIFYINFTESKSAMLFKLSWKMPRIGS